VWCMSIAAGFNEENNHQWIVKSTETLGTFKSPICVRGVGQPVQVASLSCRPFSLFLSVVTFDAIGGSNLNSWVHLSRQCCSSCCLTTVLGVHGNVCGSRVSVCYFLSQRSIDIQWLTRECCAGFFYSLPVRVEFEHQQTQQIHQP